MEGDELIFSGRIRWAIRAKIMMVRPLMKVRRLMAKVAVLLTPMMTVLISARLPRASTVTPMMNTVNCSIIAFIHFKTGAVSVTNTGRGPV